jgi:hypothetical protein
MMMAQTLSDTTSQHAATDTAAGSTAGSDHPAATALSQQVNLMDRLHLKDPSKQTTNDLLQDGYMHVTPLDTHSAMNDPHKFLSMAGKMVDGAPGGDLDWDLLQAAQKASLTSNDEKTVAKTLSEGYMDISTDDPHSLKRLTTYVGFDIDRSVRQEGIEGLKREQQAADAFAKHPELTGPQSLTYAFKNIFENVSGLKADYGFRQVDLGTIAADKKYTEQERAAAEFVKLNFDKFATMGDKDATTFSSHDLIALANTGLPPGVVLGDTCEKSSPTANAIGYAAAVGVASKAFGSKHPLANAVAAGTSAAIATEIKNQINCGSN